MLRRRYKTKKGPREGDGEKGDRVFVANLRRPNPKGSNAASGQPGVHKCFPLQIVSESNCSSQFVPDPQHFKKKRSKSLLKEDPKHFVLSYAMVFINKQVKKVPYGTKSARSSDPKRSTGNINNF
jgi:hypothetical protein